ncbi:MAG: T9SS type A sorting domain-containing protein [Bacteroidota bacterium]|nr:T9SS type A sorting domain-containing protein [Bacteroidota bacterium]MDP4232528.1 T9SS type A sorting domain-containing protein [Bacteroidota bacterium]MDP4241663.1 T9SS type A sorting domain-containing protein [Bacteroidota bacterium]MDP4286408.1 T9SS type A sorting domain-containing protein [Bacteroidota bacterium]
MMNPNNFTIKENQAMRKRYGSWAAAIVLAVLAVFSDITPVQAQKPPVFYPTISLRNWGGRSTWDGVQRVPAPNYPGNRYFLVPVYVYNEVDTTFNPNIGPAVGGSPQVGQHLEPIRSFSFQLYYSSQGFILDSTQGNPIVMVGPGPLDTGRAKTFFTRYSDQQVNSPLNQNPYLRVIRVAGAGSVPLWNSPPTTNPNPSDTTVLLWLRFRVLPNAVQGSIIFLDSARFNDKLGDNLGGAPGFGAKYQFPYPPPSVQTVTYDYTHGNLGGGNSQTAGSPPWPGQGDVEISAQPAMILQPGNQLLPLDNNLYPLNLQLATDLTYDPANPQTVQRGLQLRDAIGLTELDNVNISSDQKWLTISLSAGGSALQTQYIKQINYGSLPSSQVQQFFLNVSNPQQYPPGIYYATVTFTADGAVNAPMKLYVKFIRLANPNEPQAGNGTGIRLNITNSCVPTCTSTLAFGTGPGASEALDLLYGEQLVKISDTINADTLGQCFAWFRPQNTAVDAKYQTPDFIGITRDIRSPNTDTTLIYEVDFMTGGASCYPVKVCVNPSDFPAGGRILLAFTLNGGQQPIDLRNATPDGNGNMCVTIVDHTINHFYILYTPGTIASLATFLEKYSWNLISLPVIPPNPDPKIIFPRAAGVPWQYSSFSSWSSATSLEFGRGYMIRYGGFIGTDGVVAGTLSPAGVGSTSVDNVKIDEGWNSVGAASYPSDETNIVLKPIPGSNQVPNLVSDVWEFDPHSGYFTSAFLVPGRGYFIKVDASGIYSLQNVIAPPPHSMAHQTNGSGKITESLTGQLSNVLLSDANGNGQTLYFGHASTSVPESHFEMPSQFQAFDARFATNSGMMSYNHSSYTVNVRASNYPVTMKFSNLTGTVEVRDDEGALLGTATGNGFVTISDASVKQVTIAEKQSSAPVAGGLSYRLDQNTPNPFAPVTTIRFATPQEQPVSLVVYNEMGEVVQTLVSGVLPAGDHMALFDATNLPAGAYYYTLKAGSFVQTERMTVGK